MFNKEKASPLKKGQKLAPEGSFREQFPMFVMISPFILFFVLFTVIPILSSIFFSFTTYDMIAPPSFIGLDNYRRLITSDTVFTVTVKNTFIFAVVAGPLGFLLAFMLAGLVNEFTPKVRALLSFMFYAPSLVGNAYFIWQVAFSGDSYGYINSLLLSFGIITEPIVWLKNATYLMPIIIIVQLWQSMGVSFLANISALQNINPELFEAGAVDGIRNRWQELWYITLPQMKSQLLFGAVMQITSALSIAEVSINIAGFPSVEYAGHTIITHLMDYGNTRMEMGYASAIAVFLFVMMVGANSLFKKFLSSVGK